MRRLVIAVLTLAVLPAYATDIQVRVDRDPVAMDESFQLTFEAEGAVDDAPDFAPLDRDFQVLSRSESSSLRIINGDVTRSKIWNLTALPKRSGKLAVPPIAFGSDRSKELTINVEPPGAPRRPGQTNQAGQTGDVFIEVEARPLKPLVQSQVIYIVRLFRGVATANASLNDPQVESGEAVIEKLGEDRSYETRIAGRRYHVVERSYGIYPQTSGKLTIAAVQFQGQTGRDSLFNLDPFGAQPRTVVRQSAPVTLDVQPVPAGQDAAHWVPARNLKLTEQWSQDPPKFRVGEPITRTLTLTADGLTASQLPEIHGALPDGFKSYPDQPLLTDQKDPGGVRGTRQEKIAIIPGAPGTYMLPEVRIAWYDVAADRASLALIPAREIEVSGATGARMPAPATAPAKVAVAPPAATDSVAATPVGGKRHWWIPISAVLALGWLATAVLWWRSVRRGRDTTIAARAQSLSAAIRAVRTTCDAGDAAAIKDALLAWARLRWSQDAPRSIGELARRVDASFAAELNALNAALYRPGGGQFRARELRAAFDVAQSAPPAQAAPAQPSLEPLYRI